MPALMGATFTTKDSLETAVQAYNTNPTTATATHGSIAGWDVSMITDMKYLFYSLKNFNADISSWDTSKVTNMNSMFGVRSARALTLTPPNSLESRAFPEHAACAAATPHPPASRRAPRPASHVHVPLPSTRQGASAFNQPLSLDTSSVTDMGYMFQVRSARALTPNSLELGLPPCMPLAPPPPRLPARTSPRIACAPPFDLAVSGRLQPAAEP